METAVEHNGAAPVAAAAPQVLFGITMNPVVSSQIDAIGHDPETGTLAIQFKAKPGTDAPGSVYHYSNVDAEKFAALAGAESTGSHFYKHIKPFKDDFPYTRML
jgi:hypothetical protein